MSFRPRRHAWLLWLAAAALPAQAGAGDVVVLAAGSATATPTPAADIEPDLVNLVAPVALYPDDLLAIVLPAATRPVQVAQAARYLEAVAQQPDLQPDADWDESVVALLNYPEVLARLNADLAWTTELGVAVADSEDAVLAAVTRFRQQARRAGNLSSDRRQVVETSGRAIAIRPADPTVLYVPDYEPATVLIHQPSFVYRYYARPFPVYYYPYPAGHTLTGRDFWGLSSVYRIAWQDRRLRLLMHQHRAHPYYGHSYAWQYGFHRLDRYDRYRPGYRQSWWSYPGRSAFHRSAHGRPDRIRTLRTHTTPRRDLAPRGERIELHRGARMNAGQRAPTPPAVPRTPAVPPDAATSRTHARHLERPHQRR